MAQVEWISVDERFPIDTEVDESVSRGCGLKRRKAKTMELNIKEAFNQHAAEQRWHLWNRVISFAFHFTSAWAVEKSVSPTRASWIRCCLFFHKSQAIKQNYLCHPKNLPSSPPQPSNSSPVLSPQLVRRLCAKKSGREATPATAACHKMFPSLWHFSVSQRVEFSSQLRLRGWENAKRKNF